MNMFDADKNENDWATVWCKNYDDMLSRFHLIPERHGQTDGRTDRQISISISRVSTLTRDKNCFFGHNSSTDCPISANFYRAMLCISAVYAGMRCLSVRLSVCLSVTFVDHVKTNKRIFEFFSPSGSHTTLVFSTPNGVALIRREPP